MSKMIQIRNVPDQLHRKLKSRAALAGMSLSDYLLAQIREIAARPTMEEMIARIERLPPVVGGFEIQGTSAAMSSNVRR